MDTRSVTIDQLVREGIARLRVKLLDLSNRNRLINFKFSETSRKFVRVVDEVPKFLFERLTDDSARSVKLYFQALPEPPPEPESPAEVAPQAELTLQPATGAGQPAAPAGKSGRTRWGKPKRSAPKINPQEWARKHGIDPSFDLPEANGSSPQKHLDNIIQTLLLPEQLERKVSAIREDAKLSYQELGLGTLFAAFCFLEWYESTSSNEPIYSPLLLLPVQIDRELRHGQYRYFIEAGDGSEPLTNVSLRERLRRDFGLVLPEVDEDDTPDSYAKRVAKTLENQKRWKVRRFMIIGHFAFARLAMYEDLALARWTENPLEENLLISTLLAGAQEGASDALAPDFDVDDEKIEARVPVTITDADSSQFSAIVDAMQGRSFALKGPPGTGKSQTITNLIAAALAQGKSILFVAEKQAALDVVAKRLKEAGLEHYLFELHSTKMHKKKVLESVEARLHVPKRKADIRLFSTLAELRKTRAALKAYVSALNTPIGASGITLHDAYWREMQCRPNLTKVELQNANEVASLPWTELSAHDYSGHEEVLSRTAAAHENCRLPYTTLDRHPLYGLCQLSASGLDRDQLKDTWRRWELALTELEKVSTHVGSAFSCALPNTSQGIAECVGSINSLPEVPASLDAFLLSRIKGRADLETLERLQELVKRIIHLKDELAEVFSSPDAVLAAAGYLTPQVQAVDTARVALRLDRTAVADLPDLIRQRGSFLANVLTHLAIIEAFAKSAGLNGPLTHAVLAELVDAIALVQATPGAALSARHAGLFNSDAQSAIEQLSEQAAGIRSDVDRLDQNLSLTYQESPDELRSAAITLRDANLFERLFGSQYRAARKLFRTFTKARWAGRQPAADLLLQASATVQRRRSYEEQATLRSLAGRTFAGIHTPFPVLLEVVKYWACARQRWPTLDPKRAPFQLLLLQAEAALLDEVSSSLGSIGIEALRTYSSSQTQKSEIEVTARIADLQGLVDRTLKPAETLAALRYRQPLPTHELTRLAQQLQAYRHLVQAAIALPLGDALPADRVLDEKDLERLEATRAYAHAVLSRSIPSAIAHSLLSMKAQAALVAARRFAELLDRCLQARAVAIEALRELAEFDMLKASKCREWAELPLQKEMQVLRDALAVSDDHFAEWTVYRSLMARCQSTGLKVLADFVESEQVRTAVAAQVLRLGYARGLIRDVTKRNPEIPTWTGDHVEGLRKRLVRLDRDYMQLSRQFLAARLSTADVPIGVSRGSVKDLTERSLIEHEIGKQRRHIPMRDLLTRASRAARALKPCFMMSPASVAQFLPPGTESFDLAIIDEASQMAPEEALGVAARAKQIIVVGDPMQLPPTSFFNTAHEEEETEQSTEELDVDTESILDLALSSLRPPRDLRWHYRSKHHSLIAFSNREFYDDRLIVFPSPKHKSTEMGVQSIYVKDATYKASLNQREAEVVIEQVATMIRARPEASIGVVAINQPQKDLLVDLFDQLFAEEEDLEDYRARWDASLEPFFVKNLENVQGDERDTIVISTVYGPDTIGVTPAQRFGPINAKMGHRRLNVLFTRAKERVLVVTSLRPEDIKPPSGESRGVIALKGYLEFARSGRLERGTRTGGSHESPFEAEVAAILQEAGHVVELQVGVAGYFIDLAVCHPLNTDHFVLGIECDGASYHSAKSARDRDRLRQEILERLGWSLHRIWSTDWFHAREREKLRLLTRLAQLTGVPGNEPV